MNHETFKPSRESMARCVEEVFEWALRHEIGAEELHECIDGIIEHENRGIYKRYWISTQSAPREANVGFSFKDTRYTLGSLGIAEVVILGATTTDEQIITLTADTPFKIHGRSFVAPEVVRSVHATV